ncbi:MMPL family transporter [Marinomonas transparens]|uniref:MMPL family protein n=1 Tax=Marinomonas transparens TaxID=2795388 RepID=A0A934JMT7_9GAMM|nr:hypothetical protein [Marinomonas transparens]MBJ7538696.1 hypothetical protein [Marinomonas transparens]
MRLNLKLAAVGWAALFFVICLLALTKQTAFDTSIMALLPKYEQRILVSEVQQEQAERYANHVFILVSAEQKEAAKAATTEAIAQLATLKDRVSITASADQANAQSNNLFAYRFSILSDAVRQRLLTKDYESQQQLALSQLFSPIGAGKADLIQDPFFLYSDLLLTQKSGIKVKPEEGLLRLTESQQPSYLLILALHQNPFDLPTQAQIMPVLESIKKDLATQGARVSYSGLLLHAAKGAEQAKSEISTIGVGSILGITLIICLVFRRIGPLFQVLFPVAIGCLVAISVTILCFDRVHLITIAFGAGLVGVAVDYSMHLVCENSLEHSEGVVKKLFIGLLLGLISSVLAYGGLALTPFPGLQQIAVFSCAGLIAAWLTVILWLPVTMPNTKTALLPAARILNHWKETLPRLDQYPVMGAFLVACLISVTAGLVYFAPTQDSIRLLQTSPSSLLKEDQHVQQALGNNVNSAFLMVSANNMESLLQQEEALRQRLDPLVTSQALLGYQSISQSLPSLQRQQQNQQLVNQLYQTELENYLGKLGLSEQQKSLASHSLDQNQPNLTADEWLNMPISAPWRSLLIQHASGEFSSVVQIIGNMPTATTAQLKSIALSTPNVDYVNQVEDISNTLARYRAKMTDWLMIAYGVITIMLFFRYRLNVWRVMLPPIAGSVLALSIAVAINGGYNLFNLIALMLVFGIGLDMGIFLQESKNSPHTWLAVSLSTVTSLLAFGLLALSQTPVLYHFGIIVLPGLTLIWLISPLMQSTRLEKL